ncbi:hypothetical protein HPB51_029633 [Rhipicephalus microplus]|uniref:Uncharacterized protein n=1 Tax=Rhipicephalus microplus TaxID=6941 RepID=A0A9J6CU32_RHIMP|nr:hypothetical protein HPB51_029633 [Rhipicephalus microplus]
MNRGLDRDLDWDRSWCGVQNYQSVAAVVTGREADTTAHGSSSGRPFSWARKLGDGFQEPSDQSSAEIVVPSTMYSMSGANGRGRNAAGNAKALAVRLRERKRERCKRRESWKPTSALLESSRGTPGLEEVAAEAQAEEEGTLYSQKSGSREWAWWPPCHNSWAQVGTASALVGPPESTPSVLQLYRSCKIGRSPPVPQTSPADDVGCCATPGDPLLIINAAQSGSEMRLAIHLTCQLAVSVRATTALLALCGGGYYYSGFGILFSQRLLSIRVALPVSMSTLERGVSKLRRLKSYLRYRMSNERLILLALLSVHRQIEVTPKQDLPDFCKLPR